MEFLKKYDLFGRPRKPEPPGPLPEYFETHDLYGHPKQPSKPAAAPLDFGFSRSNFSLRGRKAILGLVLFVGIWAGFGFMFDTTIRGGNGVFTGAVTISGAAPWIDGTAPPYNMKCDGATNDSPGLQAALNQANTNKGGVVYIPPAKGTTCVLATQINMDQMVNVTLRGDVNGNGQGQAIASRPLLLYTATTSPAFSMRSSTSLKIQGLMIELNNAGFNSGPGGMIFDTEHVTASDSTGNIFSDLNINGGAAASNVACAICLDKSVAWQVYNVNFTNMVNAIRGRVNIGSYSTWGQVWHNYFDISAGTITGAFILNPGLGWSILNNDWEVTGGVNIMDETGGGCVGCSFVGNNVGDVTNTYNGTFFKNIGCDGSLMSGNYFAGGGTNTGFMSFISGGGCWTITGNTFNSTWGTLYSNASNNTTNMTILSNVYGTVTAFGLGQFASPALIQDNTGAVTVQDAWVFGFNSSLTTRNGITPQSAGGADVGSVSLPFANLWLNGNIKGASLVVPSNSNTVTLLNLQGPSGAVTGTGSPVTLYTYTLPGNTLRVGTCFEVTIGASHSTGTASVAYAITYGGTTLASNSSATTGQGTTTIELCDIGATNTQKGMVTNSLGIFSNNLTNPSSAIDSTVNQAIAITFNVAASDQVTPEYFRVRQIQ